MKKKGKITMTITIGIGCFILVMIIFMQFKVVSETNITNIENMREEELKVELADWTSKYEETLAKYEETVETLNKYKEESSSDAETKANLEEELENLNIMLGVTDVTGPGIIITLQEGENVVQSIKASELMIIVNYLKEAGAEAISINDQRIVNSTYIVEIDTSFIKVNSQRVTAPYIIKVIGDPDYLKSALIGAGGYAESIEAWGQEITIEEDDDILILKYDEELEINYIEN